MATHLIHPPKSLTETFRTFSPQVKAALITVTAMAALSIPGLVFQHFLYVKENSSLRQEVSSKNARISDLEKTIGDLRYENSALRTSNSTSEIILDPVRRVARELHPEMETAAAVGKLADDLRQVRLLATKDLYRPLDAYSGSNLVSALRQIQVKYGTNKINVEVFVGTSKNMMLLGNECVSILTEAGWNNSGVGTVTRTQLPPPPDAVVRFHPDERGLVVDFAHAIQTLVKGSIGMSSGSPPDGRVTEKGTLRIEFNAELLFLPNGSVLFK